jgi:putative phosphoribosyl transferase
MLETITRRFADRHAAGRELAERLSSLVTENPIVLGLARGGVPVAYEVAQALGAPLDVLVVRKIGAPGNPEYGIGAIAEGDVRVLNQDAVRHLLVSVEELEAAIARARAEVDARVERYRGCRPPLEVRGQTALVVDDGLATGGTARAALRAVSARDPRRLILAVPVGAPESVESLREEADEVICLLEPELMWAVGLWYEHFEPTSDAEIARLLAGGAADPPPRALVRSSEVRIPVAGGLQIVGDLVLPEPAQGLVVFAHGSGLSRHSPRNRQVARALNERRLGTLLLDPLTVEEELHRANVFDIGLLAERLIAATRWAQAEPQLAGLPVGYFGASTGAGAALSAAAELGDRVGAVVSRGGRPDLAAARLPGVRAPVLLIVGGHDEIVIELNRDAQSQLRAPSELAIVPGATHLFEEPGALEEVSRLAGEWFEQHLIRAAAPRA